MSATKPSRPKVTLFLSSSVDGKLTSHDSDRFDMTAGWKEQPGIRAILQRFYDFSDPSTYSLTSGSAVKFAGVGNTEKPEKSPYSLIVFDYTHELSPHGVSYLAQCFKKLYIVGALGLRNRIKKKPKNLNWIAYRKGMRLDDILKELGKKKVHAITVHSDALMNAQWIASGLVDALTIVIAPLLVGNNGTPTLMDVFALLNKSKRGKNTLRFPVTALNLVETRAIGESYLFLRYEVKR